MDKNLSIILTHRTGVVELQGYFEVDSSGDPTAVVDSPDITWTYDGANGEYTGTFAAGCKMISPLWAQYQIEKATASAQFCEPMATALSTGVVHFATCAIATGVHTETGVAMRIYFNIIGKNSTTK
jgi:hypothetical protein